MARFELRFCVMAVVLAVAAGLAAAGEDEAWAMARKACQGDMQGISTRCGPYIWKRKPRVQPSQGCCDIVKNADVSCMCKHLSHDLEQELNMDNVVYVAGYCGNPLSHGMQCGGYTVP